MGTSTILLLVLIVLLIGALPAWPHSKSWGIYPSGGLGLVLVVVLVLMLTGHI
ncbi:MAG TPA: DUF3309 family protein [Patescibacteria group bacterium]|nr:DUF3309 family protein [Patescibacteria group bacterium]